MPKLLDRQKIIEQLNDGMSFDPEFIPEFTTTKEVIRAIAYLLAWNKNTGNPQKVTVTSDGSLRVAQTGAGFEYNDTKTGNAPDAYGSMLVFDQVVGRIDVFTWDNPCLIKRSLDGIVYQDEVEIPANGVYTFDAATAGINIINKTPGSVCRYSIIGWY